MSNHLTTVQFIRVTFSTQTQDTFFFCFLAAITVKVWHVEVKQSQACYLKISVRTDLWQLAKHTTTNMSRLYQAKSANPLLTGQLSPTWLLRISGCCQASSYHLHLFHFPFSTFLKIILSSLIEGCTWGSCSKKITSYFIWIKKKKR